MLLVIGTDASEPVDHSQQELEEGHSPLAQGRLVLLSADYVKLAAH